MKAKHAPLCLLLGLSMAAAVTARECPVEAPRQIPPTVLTGGFFDAHPDLFWRSMAQRAERDKRPARALDYYKRSARYADKFSQAMVARLYQEGIGTRADPVMAYIWMDLAAERMYHDFLVLREHYWARLTHSSRHRRSSAASRCMPTTATAWPSLAWSAPSGTVASRSPAAALGT